MPPSKSERQDLTLTDADAFAHMCAGIGYTPESVVTTLVDVKGISVEEARRIVRREYEDFAGREGRDAPN